jgi:hypothetical protein
MTGKFDIYGVFVPALLVWALVALSLTGVLRTVLARVGFYRLVWHRPLVDLSLHLCGPQVIVVVLGLEQIRARQQEFGRHNHSDRPVAPHAARQPGIVRVVVTIVPSDLVWLPNRPRQVDAVPRASTLNGKSAFAAAVGPRQGMEKRSPTVRLAG